MKGKDLDKYTWDIVVAKLKESGWDNIPYDLFNGNPVDWIDAELGHRVTDTPKIPSSVFTVEYHDYEYERSAGMFYSKDIAELTCKEENLKLYSKFIDDAKNLIDTWKPRVKPLTDLDRATEELFEIVRRAKGRGVRKVARETIKANGLKEVHDPRRAVLLGEMQLSMTFEQWLVHEDYAPKWYVYEQRVEDAGSSEQ